MDFEGGNRTLQSSSTYYQSTLSSKKTMDSMDEGINYHDSSSAGIMNVYKKLKFGEHIPFYDAKGVKAEGIVFCNDSFSALTGSGHKIMRHDLVKGGDPELIYECAEEFEKFTFEYLKGDKLIIIESSRVYVVDLKQGKKVIAEITADQLNTDQIYGYYFDSLIYQGHLIDDEQFFIMKLPQKI